MKNQFASLFVAAFAVLSLHCGVFADVIQVNVSSILNTRSITTLTNGSLVTWINGVDGGGASDGYLTMAASLFKGDKNPHALPDSGKIAADTNHPEVMLNYSNSDGKNNQTHFVVGSGEFTFSVPQTNYSKMFLFFTSSEGTSSIQVTLTYADATESKAFVVPDYYTDIPSNDQNFCYLVKDLAKWNKQNVMTETNHHNIDALNVHPNAAKVLTAIKVQKSQAGYMVFWGATGVSTKSTYVEHGFSNCVPGNTIKAVRAMQRTGVGNNRIALVNIPAQTDVSVFSTRGQNSYKASFVQAGTIYLEGVNGKKLPPGTYVCRLTLGEEIRYLKVFKAQ